MAVKIRQYREADKAALVACLSELQQHIASLDPLRRIRFAEDYNGEAYVQRLLEKIQSKNGTMYLADDNEKIVGCIAGIIPGNAVDDDLEAYPSKDGKILELYVHPSYRRKQVGLGLMCAIEQYFQEAGCKGCHVDCFAPNLGAHEFYIKLGYIDRVTTLLKILDDSLKSSPSELI
ncbi:GNAT family N-acetyltransferase [Candidatus Peregrinibacteria bacterium]|nr:GNAT family N-acetyltransferase [Candidatus Peregrinibacteria bacterium]